MSLPRVIFGAAVVTAALAAANHWPARADATVRHGNHDGARYVELDCGPGPRVLVLGGSVANGWGASALDREWWAQACRRAGGVWRNAAQPARRVGDEIRQADAHAAFGAEVTIALDGANDLILGLAPQIRGQIERRVEAYRVGARELRRRGVVVVLQPIPLGGPSLQTAGYEARLREAYREMAREADVDLSALAVDYLDVVHFGDAGHAALAEALTAAISPEAL